MTQTLDDHLFGEGPMRILARGSSERSSRPAPWRRRSNEREPWLTYQQKKLDTVHALDDPPNMDTLTEIGAAAATKLVADEHFPADFDVA